MNFRAFRTFIDLRDFRAFRAFRALRALRDFRVLMVFMDLKFLVLTIVNMSIKKVMWYTAIHHTREQENMMEKTLTTMLFTNGSEAGTIQYISLNTMHQMTSLAFGLREY